MLTISPRQFRATLVVVAAFVGFTTLLRLPNSPDHLDHVDSSSYFTSHLSSEPIDWTRFAYTQYATDRSYLCNSLMIFEALHRLGSKADRLLMYPADFFESENHTSMEARLLRAARDKYAVKLKPIKVQLVGGEGAPWSESYTKLLAFNQTQYDRVLNLDSDATILQSMDELFLLPSSPVAMPQAYWLDLDHPPQHRVYTSGLLLVQPSATEFSRIMDVISTTAGPGKYDMEIMNELYGDSARVVPHRPYTLLTGEFRAVDHSAYLGNTAEAWDAERVFAEAKYLHFSDWPVPKPWFAALPSVIEEAQPACEFNPATGHHDDCRARDIWLGIYEDFKTRRNDVCMSAIREGPGSTPLHDDTK